MDLKRDEWFDFIFYKTNIHFLDVYIEETCLIEETDSAILSNRYHNIRTDSQTDARNESDFFKRLL